MTTRYSESWFRFRAPLLRDALDTALADGAKEVEADFARPAYIDSTGIGVLI